MSKSKAEVIDDNNKDGLGNYPKVFRANFMKVQLILKLIILKYYLMGLIQMMYVLYQTK